MNIHRRVRKEKCGQTRKTVIKVKSELNNLGNIPRPSKCLTVAYNQE